MADFGRFVWYDLFAQDVDRACSFYAGIAGWTYTKGTSGDHQVILSGGEEIGRIAQAPEGVPPHWLYYFNVADIREALKQVEEAGGKVLNGPMEIPGDDWIAQCADPEGCYFALYQSGRS